MSAQYPWRVTLERKATLNANQAQRQKIDYAMAPDAESAKRQVLGFDRNRAFIAIDAKRM